MYLWCFQILTYMNEAICIVMLVIHLEKHWTWSNHHPTRWAFCFLMDWRRLEFLLFILADYSTVSASPDGYSSGCVVLSYCCLNLKFSKAWGVLRAGALENVFSAHRTPKRNLVHHKESTTLCPLCDLMPYMWKKKEEKKHFCWPCFYLPICVYYCLWAIFSVVLFAYYWVVTVLCRFFK